MTDDRPLPLTPAQQRLWVLAQLRPDDPFYNVPFIVDIDGPLDLTALRGCLDEIVRRHAPLRTRIRRIDGELVQVADPTAPVELAVVSLDDLPEPARAERAAALADDFVQAPFDLTRGPLFRAMLLVFHDRAHRLVVNVHQIVFDGRSRDVFGNELAARYEAAVADQPTPLPDLPMSYGDQLRRQRAVREAGGADEALAHWTTRLAGAPEVLELPIKAARPATSEHRAAHRSRLIPKHLIEPLRQVAHGHDATMFVVLKAACDVLLRQHGAQDVLMGVAVPDRDDPATEGLLGYLEKPVVLRSELYEDSSFGQLLARVRTDAQAARDHADLPFEAVLQALDVAHDPSYYPLYQVMFGHGARPPRQVAAGVGFTTSYLDPPTAKVELEFALTDQDGGLDARLRYRTDLFDEVTIDRLLARLETILERIGRSPDARISELMLPSDTEWRQVVEEWNRTRVDLPRDKCIHHLVEEQVDRSPDAVAVQAGQRQWTYRELDRAANQVAHRLQALAIGPELRVGICLPRSLELVAALLGVFKAGGVYVPLDATLPVARLHLLVQDADPTIILADPRHESLFDELPARVVRLEAGELETVGDRPVGRVGSAAIPANAAYLLYTSGSTGRPKGVVLEHRNLLHLLNWAHRELKLETFASVPLISAMGFDVSIFEMFTALTCGGKVVVADDAFALARTAGADTTTLLVAVPSILAELLKTDGLPRSASTVVSNGEVLPPSVLRDLYDTPSVQLVYNVYAPTETTTFSLYNQVRPGEPIPIGRPMDNTVAYVLDPQLRPVPPGVVGQLHIGGAGVTRGYLNQPGLTAERFVPDPFSTEPGQRLYATGDMVRHGPDGRILYVGRVDHQVKLRGCRIELGEVEATMLAHPGVGEACATVMRGGAGDALLAAVAARDGSAISPTEIRTFLQERLPGYMVPESIRVADKLPLLSSGKLDRKQIQQLLAESLTAVDHEPPAGEAERLVAAAWSSVLGQAAGATQNFFEAGGNSLLLVLLREELRTVFRRDVDMTDLFRHPTVRAMAEFLTTDAGEEPAVTGTSERGRARQQARSAIAQRRERHGAR